MSSSQDDFDNPTQLIFYSDVDDLPVRDLAGASAAIAVAIDYLKDRRTRIATLLSSRIGSGDIGDLKTTKSDSGKSLNVEVGAGINLRRTESGGGKVIDRKKLLALLDKKKIEHDKVLQPTGWVVDTDALEVLLEEKGIERETIFSPAGWEIDESILRALVSLKHLTQKELDSVYGEVDPRVSVTCAFDKDTKTDFFGKLKAMEGSLVGRGTTGDA